MSTKKNIGVSDIEREFGPLTFARLLFSHREAEEMSQVDMAKMLNLSKQALNDLEKGRKIPSIRRAVQIAKKMGVLEELAIQLVLQDQISKERLNFTVVVSKKPKKTS